VPGKRTISPILAVLPSVRAAIERLWLGLFGGGLILGGCRGSTREVAEAAQVQSISLVGLQEEQCRKCGQTNHTFFIVSEPPIV